MLLLLLLLHTGCAQSKHSCDGNWILVHCILYSDRLSVFIYGRSSLCSSDLAMAVTDLAGLTSRAMLSGLVSASNNQTGDSATEFDRDLSLSLDQKYPAGVVTGRIISSIVLTVGFPGNLMSACIWLRLTLRNGISSGVYLTVLAISDSVFLAAYLLQLLYFLWEVRFLSCPYTFGMCFVALMSSHYLSVLLVLAFNVDRFLAVTYPLKVKYRVLKFDLR